MTVSILDLAESTSDDAELVPEILPVDARMAARGPVSAFQALFERAATVTPAKEIIAGTGHALIEAVAATASASGYVRVTATDGDLTVSMMSDEVTVQMAGAALVPPKKISEILKLAPTQTVAVEVLGNSVTLRSGRAQWAVAVPVGDVLPPAADVSGISTQTVSATALLEALATARKAASTLPGRATLKQLLVKDGCVTGLDGRRMHRQRVEDMSTDLEVTIPLRVADEVMRLLQTSINETVEFGGNSSHLVFRVDENVLIAQQTTAAYPDISTYLLAPALTNQHSLSVERGPLADAIKRIRVNADPEYQTLFLALTPGKATEHGPSWNLTISARDRQGNSAREMLPANWQGPSGARTLTVNHKDLSELLAVCSDDQIIFRVGDDTRSEKRCLFVENTVTGFTGWVNQIRAGYLT